MKKCRDCGVDVTYETAPKSFVDRGFKICRRCEAKDKSDRLLKLRHEVMDFLGGECNCCKIKDYNYLSIDHVDGGGIEDRNKYNKWSKYLKSILDIPKEEVGKKYQILCYNCNCTKGFYGKCPHNFDLTQKLELFDMDEVEEDRQRYLTARKIMKLKLKLETIKYYGGECIICNEVNPLFLVLDHINNNGNLDGKKKGVVLFQYLRKLGYPGKDDLLQVLCYNCNSKKEYIDVRRHKILNQKNIKNEYIKQNYSISKEDNEKLWHDAKVIYALLNGDYDE